MNLGNSDWNFELIPELDEDFIRNAEDSHVFFQPSLIKIWLDTYIVLRHLTPLYIKATNNKNEAFFPMVKWRKNWKNAFLTTIVPIGYSDFDYHNPVFKNKPTSKEIESFWRELRRYLSTSFSYDSIIIDGITEPFLDQGLRWRRDDICPFLDLTGITSEEKLMAFFGTSLRGDIRRQIRRLNEIGKLEYHEFNSWEEIPKSTFTNFLFQHAQRWPLAYKAPGFHRNLLRDGIKSGIVHFSSLSVGEKEIAWHLGFRYEKTYFYYMPTGNCDFSKYSPTKIHLFYLVRHAIENGYIVFDHLRGEETYKSGWSNGKQYVHSIKLNNSGISTTLKNNVLKMRTLITPPINHRVIILTPGRLAA